MRKLALSFTFAKAGLLAALVNERNFRIQFLCALMVFLLNFIIKFETWAQALFLLITFLVLSLELINSAIEKTCDLFGTDHCEQKKYIKDLAAASVMLVSLSAYGLLLLITQKHNLVLLQSLRYKPIVWLIFIFIFLLNYPWLRLRKMGTHAQIFINLVLLAALVYLNMPIALENFSFLALSLVFLLALSKY